MALEHFFGLNLINFKCQSYCVIDRINIYVEVAPYKYTKCSNQVYTLASDSELFGLLNPILHKTYQTTFLMIMHHSLPLVVNLKSLC